MTKTDHCGINRVFTRNLMGTELETTAKLMLISAAILFKRGGELPDGTPAAGTVWAANKRGLINNVRKCLNLNYSDKTINKHLNQLKDANLISIDKNDTGWTLRINNFEKIAWRKENVTKNVEHSF